MKRNRHKMETFDEESLESSFDPVTQVLPSIQPEDDQFMDLYKRYKEKCLVLQPDFQRDFIWPPKKQKELIKSIWQGIPIPMFYFFRKEDNGKTIWEVIDGQQRLTTLFGFYDRHSLPKRIRNKIIERIGLKVGEEKISDEVIRQKFKRDDLKLMRVLFDEKDISSGQQYEIFRRLNQGAMALKAQEIRNCIMQKEMPILNDIVKKLTRLIERLLQKKFNRMFGEELVLRFFVIQKYGYEKRVSDYINFSVDKRVSEIKKDLNDTVVREYAKKFREFIKRMDCLFGENCFQVLDRNAERPRHSYNWDTHIFSGVLNQGLFHLFASYILQYNNNQFRKAERARDKIKKYFLKLLKNKKFIYLITGASTDQPRKVKISKELFEKEFLDKCFPRKIARVPGHEEKKVLFKNIPYCYLCYGKLKKVEAAEHIEAYSKGAESKLSNILLAHAKCNHEKLDRTLEGYREVYKDKIIKRVKRNKKHINSYIRCLQNWNRDYPLNCYRKLLRLARNDLKA